MYHEKEIPDAHLSYSPELQCLPSGPHALKLHSMSGLGNNVPGALRCSESPE